MFCRSALHVLYQLPRADFAAVDVAFRIDGHSLRRARPLHFERVGNTVQDVAVFEASDPDASLPSRVRCNPVGFGVGHIDHVVAQGHAARATELLPFRDERAVLVEDLDAHVSTVGDKEPPLRIHGDVVRGPEFRRPRSQFAKGLDEFSVLREPGDPRDGIRGSVDGLPRMALRDEDIAIRRHCHAARFGQGVRRVSGDPRLPEREQHLSLRTELNFTTVWPLPFASGFFFNSRSFAPRMSTTHTLPSRSTYILWGKMNMPAPKLFRRLPDESNLRTGARLEPAQLSYWNGEAPGGMSGFAPHRSATQTDSPSLSIATPFSAPHFLPSGSFPHGAMVW